MTPNKYLPNLNVFTQIPIDYICMYMVVIKYIAKCLQIVRSCLHQNINSQKKGKQKNEHTFYIIKFTLRPFA